MSILTCLALGVSFTQPAAAAPDDRPFPIPNEPKRVDRRAPVAEGRVADATGKLSSRLSADANKKQAVFVQLKGRSAAEVNTAAKASGKGTTAVRKATRERQLQVERTAGSVAAAARKADRNATQLFAIRNGLAGVGVRTNLAGLRALARRGDVVKITPLTESRLQNRSATQLTSVLKTWQDTGQTGAGIKIGVMDTGIDYTHADFGGEGTRAAYEAAEAADTEPGWETAKVVGGYDFVGDDYDANDDASVPAPDPNPLDCEGHGTHVAGTAAGFGVNADGTTFTGNYRTLTATMLNQMRIGPGTAPKASLYALRVFGCEGSTNVIMPALDWALDPNGDGDYRDHLDVLNMSLGADYDSSDDPENVLIDQLALRGVMTVNSAGNAGDFTDAGSAARRSLTVASSVDGYAALDGLRVNTPAELPDVVAGQVSQAYPWLTAPEVTGTVAGPLSAGNTDGCQPLSPADAALVAGKVAWLEWDDNDQTRRCGSVARSGNVRAAGAIGALFTTSVEEFTAGITGDAQIPVFQLNLEATNLLRPHVPSGELSVTFTGSLLASRPVNNPAAVDTISSFTSRGTHGAPGTLKPDVAAPGQTIVSANVGSGNGPALNSGTSMASPHVAGVAALLMAKYPTWSVEHVKSAIMNTAVRDLYTEENQQGDVYGPNRVGAGRLHAWYAANTSVIAYSTSDPGVVSASFGVVEAPITSSTVNRTKKIRVRNVSSSTKSVSLSYDALVTQPGVRYSVSPTSLRIPARSYRDVMVTMTVRPSSLRRTMDPTMSDTTVSTWTGEGFRQFVSDASGRLLVKPSGKTALRVPVYGAAKPASVTTASVGSEAITIQGRGVDQGEASEAYVSAASLLTMGASSRKLPTCVLGQQSGCVINDTARSSDLRYVGAGSVQQQGTDDDGWLWFGVSMWGNAAHLGGGRETQVGIDTDADGEFDFVVAAFTPADSDQPIAVLFDAEGEAISAAAINFVDGEFDTNQFDTDTFLIPVWAADIGMAANATSFPIRYQAYTFNEFDYNGGAFDATDWVSYDVANPAVQTKSVLYPDYQGEQIDYTATAPAAPDAGAVVNAAPAATTVQGLLLHLHGRTGYRAEIVNLPVS